MKPYIYLAGGIRSDWQQKVIDSVNYLTFFNPRSKEVDKRLTLDEFGTWDLHHVRACDLVFAYMEKSNPSGVGMAVELGYAKGLGKTIILCLESDNEHIKDKYLSFMTKVADAVYTDLDDAISHLKLYGNNA
jgi:nucleoside 2-deoxyribosyltransferase